MRGWVLEADTAKAVPLDELPGRRGRGAASRPHGPRRGAHRLGRRLAQLGRACTTRRSTASRSSIRSTTSRRSRPNGVDGDQRQLPRRRAGGRRRARSARRRADDVRESAQPSARSRLGADRRRTRAAISCTRRDGRRAAATRRASASTAATRYSAAAAPRLGVPAAARPPSARRFRTRSAAACSRRRSSVRRRSRIGACRPSPAGRASTLLHGCVLGVPSPGPRRSTTGRQRGDVGVALGEQGDDLAAVLASTALGSAGGSSARRALERLLAAFTGHLLDRVGSSDGLVDVEEHEHAASVRRARTAARAARIVCRAAGSSAGSRQDARRAARRARKTRSGAEARPPRPGGAQSRRSQDRAPS